MRILLVEDDSILGDGIVAGLKLGDYAVDWVRDGESARLALLDHPYDACVLDLGLPDGEGLDLVRGLRRRQDMMPILVLTARGGLDDRVTGLDAGADDYLVKPFGAGELLARVRAQLRRQTRQQEGGSAIIRFATVHIDLIRRVVERDGERVHLTPIEYRLLVALATQPDRVLTYRMLLNAVWGPGHAEDTHYVRVHMANLRKKIEAMPSMPQHLLTEPGVGYRFSEERRA